MRVQVSPGPLRSRICGAFCGSDTWPRSAVARGEAALYAGAIGVVKNPTSHRQVEYDDPTEAAEAVLLAVLLLRLLDRRAKTLPSRP